MRRGRPGKPQSSHTSSARPSPSPYRNPAGGSSTDPFAALDGGASRKKTVEEMSKRFPSLDQFDILHEKGDKFEFEPTVTESKPEDEDLSQRLTNALADDAFARQQSPEREQKPAFKRPSQASPVRSPNAREVPTRQPAHLYQPTPQRPTMVSTGTMTSPAQTPRLPEPKISSRPIYRFPSSDNERPSNQPWKAEDKVPSPPMSSLKPEASPRLSSDRISTLSNSARPSMETLRRPSGLEMSDPVGRSKSAVAKARPMSVQSPARYDLPRNSKAPAPLWICLVRSMKVVRRYELSAPTLIAMLTGLIFLRMLTIYEQRRKRKATGSVKNALAVATSTNSVAVFLLFRSREARTCLPDDLAMLSAVRHPMLQPVLDFKPSKTC